MLSRARGAAGRVTRTNRPLHVSFLIAGVQKGGTTALDDYLREHPGVRMCTPKEAHFFDDESIDWRGPPYGRFHSMFEPAADGVLRGEATPIYLYWPESLERVRRYRPDMRLILLFRDPVERAWSHWKMETDRGWEREPFAWCVREGRARVADAFAPPGAHRVFSYVERGFYGAQLERALGLFGRDQLLLLRSEDLKREPEDVLDRVTAFLGLPPFPEPPRRRELNVAAEASAPPEADADHLAAVYRDDLTRFAKLSGLDVSGWPTVLRGRG